MLDRTSSGGCSFLLDQGQMQAGTGRGHHARCRKKVDYAPFASMRALQRAHTSRPAKTMLKDPLAVVRGSGKVLHLFDNKVCSTTTFDLQIGRDGVHSQSAGVVIELIRSLRCSLVVSGLRGASPPPGSRRCEDAQSNMKPPRKRAARLIEPTGTI